METLNNPSKYRADIDGLRALAILLVIFFHAFPKNLPSGFIGVDIFFVISGYLITTIIVNHLNNNSFSFKQFYIRRINRIFPILLVALACFFILGWFSLLADELKAFGKYMAAAGLFFSNFALWQSAGYFDIASELKPLLHLWSLGIEEQFYLLWPLILWVAYKKQINLLLISLIFFTISYLLNIKGIKNDPTGTFYLPHTRFFELLMGGILANLHISHHNYLQIITERFTGKYIRLDTLRNTLSLLGLTCIVIAAFTLNSRKPFPGNNAFLPIIGAALIITAGPKTWFNHYILSSRLVVWIGLLSFSLYIWHWPILSFVHIMEQGTPSRAIRYACLGVSFLLAAISYYCVEKPIRFGNKQGIKAFVLFCLLLAVTGLGFYTDKKDGFTARSVLAGLKSSPEYAGKLPPEVEKRGIPPMFGIASHIGKKSVYILGDSHAHHLLAGFFRQYPRNHINIILHPGCPFLLGIDRIMSNTSCLALTNLVFSEQQLTEVKTVIFSFRMFAYNKSGFEYNPERQDWGLSYKSKRLAMDDLSFWQPALRETLQLLLNKNKRVIIAYDVPELYHHIKECLKNRPLKITSGYKNCNMPRDIVDKRQAAVRQLFADILKEFPQVEVFDPLKYFCDDKWCYAFNGDKPLYYDDDHLSAAGSEFYARAFAKEFPSLIKHHA